MLRLSPNPRKILTTFLCVLGLSFFVAQMAGASAELPILDYSGSWTYTDEFTAKGPDCDNDTECRLDFSSTSVTFVQYLSGTFSSTDNIVGATILIDTMYNDPNVDSLYFEALGGGPVSFVIGYDTNSNLSDGLEDLYFTAELSPFTADVLAGSTRHVNEGFDEWNLDILTLNSNPGTSGFSTYIDELMTINNDGIGGFNPANFWMPLSFSTGAPYDFTVDSSGTFSGKLTAAPEPVSSLLFVVGGATLAARRLWKRKRK